MYVLEVFGWDTISPIFSFKKVHISNKEHIPASADNKLAEASKMMANIMMRGQT